MANVSFKKGLSTALQTIRNNKTAVPGAFYLTTDTNRLYVGKDDNTLADLNKYILTVPTLAAAQQQQNLEAGDFVYIEADNILAVYHDDGNGPQWVQINPDTDTNTDTYISSIEAEAKGNAETHQVDITLKINEVTRNVAKGGETVVEPPKEVKFAITASDMLAANNVSVGMGVGSTSDEEAIIQVEGDGVKQGEGASVKLVGGDNVTVSSDKDTDIITIAAQDTQYNIGVENNTLKFTPNTSIGDTIITYASGNDAISIDGEEKTLTITHKDFSPSTTPTAVTLTPASGESVNLLSAVVLDKGHVTNYSPVTLTLPADNNYTYAAKSITANNEGKLTFEIDGRDGGASSSITSGQVLYYTIGEHEDKYYNQGSLPVYTKTEIDDKMRGIDAMVYRGILDSTATDEGILKDAPVTNVQVGDTYKIASAGEYGSIPCFTGDLLIASGEEGEDGYITGGVTWNRVPAGDDIDTKYELHLNGTSLVMSENPGSRIFTINFTNGNDDIVLTGANEQLSIAHKEYTTSATGDNIILPPDDGVLENGGSFSVISGVTAENGHLTDYKVTNLQLPYIDSAISKLSAATNGENVDLTLTETGGTANGQSTNIKFVGGKDIGVSASTETGYQGVITIDHDTITTNTNKTNIGSAEELDYGNTITVLTDATVNNGHVTDYQYKKYTLPALDNTQYSINGSVATITDGVQITNGLTKQTGSGSNSSAAIGITSSSLKVASAVAADGEVGRVSIELEWGSF